MGVQAGIFTRTLLGGGAGTTFELDENDGIESVSLKCTSAVPIQFRGGRALNGFQSNDVTLEENQVFSASIRTGSIVLVVTVPAGATCEITAT